MNEQVISAFCDELEKIAGSLSPKRLLRRMHASRKKALSHGDPATTATGRFGRELAKGISENDPLSPVYVSHADKKRFEGALKRDDHKWLRRGGRDPSTSNQTDQNLKMHNRVQKPISAMASAHSMDSSARRETPAAKKYIKIFMRGKHLGNPDTEVKRVRAVTHRERLDAKAKAHAAQQLDAAREVAARETRRADNEQHAREFMADALKTQAKNRSNPPPLSARREGRVYTPDTSERARHEFNSDMRKALGGHPAEARAFKQHLDSATARPSSTPSSSVGGGGGGSASSSKGNGHKILAGVAAAGGAGALGAHLMRRKEQPKSDA